MDLFNVTILKNDLRRSELTLHLKIIHPDASSFCFAKQFITMLLEDAERAGVIDSSVQRPDHDAWEEEGNEWNDYIECVNVIETKNFPRDEELWDQRNARLVEGATSQGVEYWETWFNENNAEATYLVRFVSAEWIAHLPVGASWGSTAYDELGSGLFYQVPDEGSKRRRFEFVSGTSNKFWEVSVLDASHTVCYGRIGTDGRSKTKDFADNAAAQKDADKLVHQKTKKGYEEV